MPSLKKKFNTRSETQVNYNVIPSGDGIEGILSRLTGLALMRACFIGLYVLSQDALVRFSLDTLVTAETIQSGLLVTESRITSTLKELAQLEFYLSALPTILSHDLLIQDQRRGVFDEEARADSDVLL